jgi:hypothetical protein
MMVMDFQEHSVSYNNDAEESREKDHEKQGTLEVFSLLNFD